MFSGSVAPRTAQGSPFCQGANIKAQSKAKLVHALLGYGKFLLVPASGRNAYFLHLVEMLVKMTFRDETILVASNVRSVVRTDVRKILSFETKC